MQHQYSCASVYNGLAASRSGRASLKASAEVPQTTRTTRPIPFCTSPTILICALVTALMAAYGIWRTIRIAHLGTTSKLAVTAFFALAGASHFAFLDMTDLFERAFIVDTLPVTGSS